MYYCYHIIIHTFIEYITEFLLGEGHFVYNREELKKNGFGHLTSIKNVTELKLTNNPAADQTKAALNTETTASEPGNYYYYYNYSIFTN